MKNKGIKGSSVVSPVACNTKKNFIKGLGLVIFLIGAYFILSSFLGKPIIGNVVIIKGALTSTASIAGILLEIIGITLMAIKLEGPKVYENPQGQQKEKGI